MLSVRGTLYWVLFFLFTATARTASAQPVLQDTAQLRLWIKADAGITLNGSNVTRWGDQTINGFSFQQDTLARQPQLIPAALNGYPVVRFDSAQTQYMIAGDILDSIIAGAGKAFTVISVVKAGGPNQTWLAKNSDFNQNEREFILFGNATKLLNFFYSAPASSPRVIVGSNDTIRYGQFELLSASYNAAVSNSVGRVQMHIASKPQTEVLVSSAGTFPFNITDGSAPLTVGAYTNATGASGKYCLTGDIAEILIYKGVLPDSTRQKAELYLRQKYAPGVVNLGPDTTVNYGFCPITLNAGSGYYSYAWSTGSTASTAPISQSGSYSVTVTDVFGFKSSDTIQVTYPGTINYTGNTSICSGSTRVWNTGLPSGTGYSYSWSNGDTTSSLAIALPGIYQVTVTGNGCPFVSTPVAFTLDLYPDVVSLGNDTALCAGSFIGLTDGAAQTVSYLWNTGAVTPTISIPSTSTYSVTATNAAGCVGVDNILVTIAGVAPVAAFGIADFCFSEPTQFTDSSTHPNGIASWKWDFSTGDTSILQNPAYTFTTLGSKTITLVVTTGSGCKATLSKTIQVINPPVAGFTHSLVYQNAPTTLVNTTVSDSVTNYNWNWITGTSTTKNPTVSFTNAGNIPVTLSVIDVNGCADTITKNITVIAPPPAAGLCLWIRADTGLTVNGSAVSQWLDQTGNSFAFTQATVAKQPQRIPNALNGLPVVRFNGSTTYMTAGDILDSVFVGTSPTPKGSFSVVAAIKTNVANRAFIAKHSDLSENERQFLMYVNAGSKLDMAYYTPTGTPRANIEGHDDISFGEYRLLSTTYDGNNNSALDRVQMFVTSQPQTEVLASSAGTLPFNLPDGNAPLTLGGYANKIGRAHV